MKTVLITGATGAIGSAVTPLFLRERDTEVRLLLRADSEEHLRKRLHGLLQFWQIEKTDTQITRRLVALPGDVCKFQLGLNEQAYRRLAAETTHIVHAAGNVKLNQSLMEARRNALEAARQIVAFAHACRFSNRFSKIDFVSTVGVAGRTCGLVPEEPLLRVAGYHNTYEAAKAEAEAFVLEEAAKGLPATIHRPSMVVGDSSTGKIVHFQVFYYLSEFLTGCRTWGFVPRMGNLKLDIIPVDYVARILHAASARTETSGRIFHLCSGPDFAPSLEEITEYVRDFFRQHGRRLPRLRRVSASWFQACLSLTSGFVPGRTRRVFQALRFFLAYLNEQQVFDNKQTRDFFGPGGIEVPHVRDYLHSIMNYYWIAKHTHLALQPSAGEDAKGNSQQEVRQCSLQASETR